MSEINTHMPNPSTTSAKKMRAIAISRPGGPEVLEIVTLDTPQPGPGEVLIRVAAAGVNRPDCLQRRGLYPAPPGASELPGLEVAGVVIACAPDVVTPAPGDRVCALLAGGGYAEYCTAPAQQCLPAPRNLDLTSAAVIPETFFTVWTNVFQLGQLQPGQNLLVHGGASGIGTAAIQLAAALGSHVYATVGSAAKAELCRSIGADRAIDYTREDFLTELKDVPGGIDVILDIVGGNYLEQNIKILNPGGRLVVIGILGGAKGTLNLGLVLSKRITITGSTLRARSPAQKGALARELAERVWPLLEAGTVAPVLQASFPLADAHLAHSWLEGNQAEGKVALIVDPVLAASVTGA